MAGDTPVRRPRIVHVIHNDGPGGGPKTIVGYIRFKRQWHDIGGFHGGSGRIAAACEELGIEHRRLPLDRKWKIPIGLLLLVCHFRRVRPDLVVLHGQWAGPVGALAARIACVPRVVYIAHWPAFYTDWDWWRVNRNFILERIPCRLSDRVVTLSVANRYQYLVRRLVEPERLALLSNSIDLHNLPSPETVGETRRRFGWADDQCHAVSVGRLATQKSMDWLLHSWKIVEREATGARLWIVGDGEENERLRALSRDLIPGSSCAFLGPQSEGIDFVAAADIVVMTSLYEGHANIPLEAMACGKPIVASKVDGVTDSVLDGRTGFLVEPGDIETFAARTLELVRDPALRDRMGAEGRCAVRRFDRNEVLARFRDLYDSLVREGLSGTGGSGATVEPCRSGIEGESGSCRS